MSKLSKGRLLMADSIGHCNVFIEKCRFFSHHGVMEQERIAGNEYEVSVNVILVQEEVGLYDNEYFSRPISNDSEKINQEDCLLTTLSYVDIYNITKEEMDIPHNLLETVARRIAARILKQFEIAETVTVDIVKITPPISGFTGRAGVNYRLVRHAAPRYDDELPF